MKRLSPRTPLLSLLLLLAPAAYAQAEQAQAAPAAPNLSATAQGTGSPLTAAFGAEVGPGGVTPQLGLRGVQLGGASVDARLSPQGGEVRSTRALALPLIGYGEASAEAQWLWGTHSAGRRLAASGVLAAGPVEVRLAGESFTAPLLLLRPLETFSDPTPDLRPEGTNAAAALRARLGPGTFAVLGREWGHHAGTTADLELRPQRWSVDGGPAVLALLSPAEANPELWAEPQGTLTLRLGAEQRQGSAGLRLGAGWENLTSRTELGAVLGNHREVTARWQAYDLLGQDSQLELGAVLSDAWTPDALGAQWQAALLLPLAEGRQLELRGTAGAAGAAARAVYLVPLRPVPTAQE